MSNRYWNGHCWRDTVATMSKLEPVASVLPTVRPTDQLHSLYGESPIAELSRAVDSLQPLPVIEMPAAAFEYRQHDFARRRELRADAEVFSAEALADREVANREASYGAGVNEQRASRPLAILASGDPDQGAPGLPPPEPATDDRGMTYREESNGLPQVDRAHPDHSKCTTAACSKDCDGPAAKKLAADAAAKSFRQG